MFLATTVKFFFYLVANAKMFVWDELWPFWWTFPFMLHVKTNIHGHQRNTRSGHKEG